MPVTILNESPKWEGEVRSGMEVSRALQKLMLKLQGLYLAEDGSGVDYVGLCASKEFEEYKKTATELQAIDPTSLVDEQERRCFFLNVYNALTVHGICHAHKPGSPPPTKVTEIPNFWTATSYRFGPYVMSLDDIEHGVLRENKPHPSPIRGRLFQKGDPRLALVVPLDCRLHFALVCGARSCPPIRVFNPANLERGLAAAAANFLDQSVQADAPAREVTMSKLLDWYGTDFGASQNEILTRVSELMSPGTQKEALETILATSPSQPGLLECLRATAMRWFGVSIMPPGHVKIKYTPYDWSLNHKKIT